MAETPRQPVKQPKAVIGFLVVFSILILFLGFWQLNNYLKTPFIINFQESTQDLRERIAQVKSNVSLQFTDTDQDGLTDYDELNIYKTSPYLEDSDSDGITDYDEITQASDPNCPLGQICLINTNQPGNLNVNQMFPEFEQPSEEQLLAQTIRQALIANGVSAAELELIDDQTLIQMYNQVVLPAVGENQNNNLNLPAGVTKEQLLSYDVEQIGQVLIMSGISAEDVDKIPDQELIKTWQEIINES